MLEAEAGPASKHCSQPTHVYIATYLRSYTEQPSLGLARDLVPHVIEFTREHLHHPGAPPIPGASTQQPELHNVHDTLRTDGADVSGVCYVPVVEHFLISEVWP